MRNLICILILILFCFRITLAQDNNDFEDGLNKWSVIGTKDYVSIDSTNAYRGKKCIKLGAGQAGIEQQFKIIPLSIIKLDTYIKTSSDNVKGFAFIRCYDTSNTLILEFKSKPINSQKYQKVKLHIEAPANTAYMRIGLEGEKGNKGYVYTDSFSKIMKYPIAYSSPTCNLNEYMKPFWQADTIFNETVLLYQTDEASLASGRLFFAPSRILSVKDYSLTKTYVEGKDFTVSGNILSRLKGAPMPYKKQSELNTDNFNWNTLQSQWVVATYIPKQKNWKATLVNYKGNLMINTMNKLKSKLPLTIVALGMSITRGQNVSSYDNVPPYMPNYVDLFAYQLKKQYGYDDIIVVNASLPGATSGWGAKYADKYVNEYKPDLVIIDFGMNDFWRIDVPTFKSNIQESIAKIKSSCPDAEFLLLSNILFDPQYLINGKTEDYYNTMKGYNTALKSMETSGIINLDMTTISDSIYNRKKPKDCLNNPLHPNDYLARWYAQCMVTLFDTATQIKGNDIKIGSSKSNLAKRNKK